MQHPGCYSRSMSFLCCSTSSAPLRLSQQVAERRCCQQRVVRQRRSLAGQALAADQEQTAPPVHDPLESFLSLVCMLLPRLLDLMLPASSQADPFAETETYNDSPLDKFMISYFSKRMSQQLGGISESGHARWPQQCWHAHSVPGALLLGISTKQIVSKMTSSRRVMLGPQASLTRRDSTASLSCLRR